MRIFNDKIVDRFHDIVETDPPLNGEKTTTTRWRCDTHRIVDRNTERKREMKKSRLFC